MPNIFHNSLSLGYPVAGTSYPIRGLIARYGFDSSLNDTYGSNNGFTTNRVTDTPLWAYDNDGKIGKGIKPGPNDSYGNSIINSTDTSVFQILNGSNPFSVSAWCKVTNTSQTLACPISFYSSGTLIWSVFYGGAAWKPSGSVNGCIGLGYTGGSDWCFSNSDYRDNVYHHIVGTYDGTNYNLYVDNSYVSNKAKASFTTPNKVAICGATTSWELSGIIDLVYFYNVALTTNEISQLYNGGNGI